MEYLNLVGSKSLLSGRVLSKLGDDFGSIKELLIDPNSGKIVLFVVGVGGILGLGESEKIIPHQALELNPNTNNFELLIDKETFDVSPVLSREDLGDRTALKALYDYYGFPAYWEGNIGYDTSDATYQNAEDNSHQAYEGSYQLDDDTLRNDANNHLSEEVDWDKVKGEKSPEGERDNFSADVDVKKIKGSDEKL